MTNIWRRLGAAAMASAMCMGALAGCGGSSGSSTSSTGAGSAAAAAGSGSSVDNSDISISCVLKTLSNEYWRYVGQGCEQAGKDLGVNVEVVGASSETAYDEQLNMIDTLLASGKHDAYVIAPLQTETVAVQIANEEKPIVAIDTAIDSDNVISFVGFDNEEMAAMGGKAAVEAAQEAGWDEVTAICLAGVQGDPTTEARIDGYKEGIEGAGGTFLEDETFYAEADAAKAVTAMEGIMQNHPEGISVIICTNDDVAAGAARAAKDNKAYKDTIFVGCGGNVGALEAILNGKETMTVAVDGYDVGYRGVEAAVEAVKGNSVEEFIASPATIVTAENAQEQLDLVNSKQNG